MTNPTPPGQVPEALRLADECGYELAPGTRAEIAAELLRLHAENKRFAALVEAQQPAPSAAGAVSNTLHDLDAGIEVMAWLRESGAPHSIYSKMSACLFGDPDRTKSPTPQADSVTAPAGGGVVTDGMVLAALRVQYPAAYGQYLRHPANGPKTSLRTESEIDTARRMIVAALSVAPTPPAQAADSVLEDAARLDWLQANSCDLRCISVPTGGDDYDINWVVIEHYEAEPHEREIGRSYQDDPRAAINAARKQGGAA